MLTENFTPYIHDYMKGLNFEEVAKKISPTSEQNKYIIELLSAPLTREKIKKLTEMCLYFRKDLSKVENVSKSLVS